MKFFLPTLLLLAASPFVHAAGTRPNIVILFADDMGYGDLSVQNPKGKIPTPNLDRMATEGIRFTDAHSSSGICTPSRYAMLTGRHHWRDFHGIVNAFGRSVFKKGQVTIASMLRENGYDTQCVGKWHLGWNYDAIRKPGSPAKSIEYTDFDWTKPIPDGPLDHGFDHYFGDDVINFPPYAWIEDNRLPVAPDMTYRRGGFKGKPLEGEWECRPGPGLKNWDPYKDLPTLVDHAEAFVASRKDNPKPFLLYFAMPSPHAPIVPSKMFAGKTKAGPYGDYVAETDDACGRVLAALRKAGLAENTLVIFSADNGPENYAYDRDEKYDHWSSEPFRGLKRDTYEGGHHVPCLVRWPGVVRPGVVSDALISQVDFMATFADIAGCKLPKDPAVAADSFDYAPYLRGTETKAPRDTIVHNTNAGLYAIRHGDFVLVDAKTGYTETPSPAVWNLKHGYSAKHDLPAELYDMRADPGERQNIAAAHPEKVAELKALLKQIRAGDGTAPRLTAPTSSSDSR